jgi:hypothetical protein
MLSVSNKPFMLSVVMLNIIMLNVIMLDVVMLNKEALTSNYAFMTKVGSKTYAFGFKT